MKHPNRGFSTRHDQHRQPHKLPVIRERRYRQVHRHDHVFIDRLEALIMHLMWLRYSRSYY